MRKPDIKRLEKAVKKYEEIEKLLETVSDSLWKHGPTEYVNGISTSTLLKDMLEEATDNRRWIQTRIKLLKEQDEAGQTEQ